MTKAQEEPVILPPGPVDFDKLQEALRAGKSGDDAVKAATKDNPKPKEVDMEAVAKAEQERIAALMEPTPEATGTVQLSKAGKE